MKRDSDHYFRMVQNHLGILTSEGVAIHEGNECIHVKDVIFEKATAMKFLRNRIRFFRPDGTRGDSPGCGSILIAFGEDNAEILRTCDIAGKYIRIN